MPALILQLTRLGFLLLLWLFILAAIRVIHADMRLASEGRVGVMRQSRRSAQRNAPAPMSVAAMNMTPTVLVVTAGKMAGTKLRLGSGPILIGRAPDSTLVLDDDYTSTRHARLIRHGTSWAVEDLGSTNGTYVDRTRVSAPTPVMVGMPIRIGQSVLELRP